MVLPPSLSSLRSQHACVLLVLWLTNFVVPEEVYLNKIAVHINGDHAAADRVARDAGLRNIGQIGTLAGHYLFEIPHRQARSADPSHSHHAALSSHPHVHWFEQQVMRSRKKRDFTGESQGRGFQLNDPYYGSQWYLHGGGHGGFDMNVLSAWEKGYTGKNIVVSILDDGIERDHPDLQANYDPYASYDVNAQDNDPMPRYDATDENRLLGNIPWPERSIPGGLNHLVYGMHGTRCAGEVSATANNSQCAVGIAYNSKIGGVRMLDGEVFDAVEAASLSFNRSHIDIYSASWGPDDDGRVVDGPGPLAKKAFENGIKYGRDGKGSIFVWASGNGGSAQDSCNCDGYANSIYTLSISSTSEHGTKPWYLEECASTLATTYSSGAYNEKQIVTVDLHKRCTQSHTGTSASAPLAAGIVALILEANPELTWRDVQYITLMTSRPEPMVDGQWVTNALGRKVSLRYGYGLMDASRMVELALKWRNVPEQHICLQPSSQKDQGLVGQKHTTTITTDGCKGQRTEVQYLEHVQCRISLSFHPRGSIVLHLTSPQGTRSTILPRRPNDVSSSGFNDWPFLSVHFWGEDPRGQWTLEIENGNPYRSQLDGGRLVSWSLVFHGTKEQPVRLAQRNESQHSTSPQATRPTTAAPKTSKPSTPKPTTQTAVKPTIAPEVLLYPKCHPECVEGCRGSGAKDCVACKHFTNESNRACISWCEDGTYKEGRMCKACHESCRTCFGPTLVECLSCPTGIRFHPKHNTCAEDCMVGTYYGAGHCLPCDKTCKTCQGPGPRDCASCKEGQHLLEGACSRSWIRRMPGSIQGLVLGLVLLCSLILLVIGVILAILLRRQRKLCWAYDRYDKLPCHDGDEDEGTVAMTYGYEDDLKF
ncbi:furin-like protease kpc-1 isoform X2 [Babylonia areolata]|uniref:furin-like protease kpc-1 isoform X2 n=1 Tax=Babylonia areolata TaxID=304850 RepID=UPI003FD4EE85